MSNWIEKTLQRHTNSDCKGTAIRILLENSNHVGTAAFGCPARAKLGRFPGLKVSPNPDRQLLLQIDVLHIFNRVTEETFSQPPELLHRIGGEELEAGKRARFFSRGGRGH